MEIISYTDQWRDKLLEFMMSNYPNRSENFLKWAITGIEEDAESQKRTFLIVSEDKIFGCTLALPLKFRIEGKENIYTSKFNTIISSEIRGMGLGKKLFEKRYTDNKESFSIGQTQKAIILHKKLNDIFVNPVRVYISINFWLLKSLWNTIRNKRKKSDQDYIFPNSITINKIDFKKINSSDELDIPKDGYWLDDKIELVRDKNFIQKRFFDIYQKYHVYRDFDNTCYFIIRSTYVNGVEMFSLVDYRVRNSQQEKNIFQAAVHITQINRVGAMITLSSKKHSLLRFFPLTIRLSKKLSVSTAMTIFKPDEKIFITSADSDLDFVYYK